MEARIGWIEVPTARRVGGRAGLAWRCPAKTAGDLMVALRVLGGWWLPAMTNNMKPKKMKASVTQYRRLRTSLDISVDASAFWRAAKAR